MTRIVNNHTWLLWKALWVAPAALPHDMRRAKDRINMHVVTRLEVVGRGIQGVIAEACVGHQISSGITARKPTCCSV
jgi:hypothetical protein